MRSINSINHLDNTVIRDSNFINQEFMQFYKLLYTSQGADMVKYTVGIPSLTEECRVCLEKDITETEIQEAISCLAVGKSPGMDSFSMDFLKSFLPKLIKPLNNMYLQAIETQHLP